MIITNKHNLPPPIYNAIANRKKPDLPKAHIWNTRLIDSPQIKRLRKEHEDEIEEDAMDMAFVLFGQMMHKIFEDASRETTDS